MIQANVEDRLERLEPDVEVLLAERVGGGRVRLVIDRAGGVDLGLCERVTGHLRDLLADAALEVSSPGPERPLTKPDHFRRFSGRRARVRTRAPRGGRRSFTGEIVDAADAELTLATDDGLISIPYPEIGRANLLADQGSADPVQPNPPAEHRGG